MIEALRNHSLTASLDLLAWRGVGLEAEMPVEGYFRGSARFLALCVPCGCPPPQCCLCWCCCCPCACAACLSIFRSMPREAKSFAEDWRSRYVVLMPAHLVFIRNGSVDAVFALDQLENIRAVADFQAHLRDGFVGALQGRFAPPVEGIVFEASEGKRGAATTTRSHMLQNANDFISSVMEQKTNLAQVPVQQEMLVTDAR